jgi:hypothetical protein
MCDDPDLQQRERVVKVLARVTSEGKFGSKSIPIPW